MTEPPPVIVSTNVEYPGGNDQQDTEIERGKWDEMTREERVAELEAIASDHAAEYVGWGWYIADPTDAADAGQP